MSPKHLLKIDYTARSLTIPGKVNREIRVALENLRPAIVKEGLAKMIKISINQLGEINRDIQCENVEHGKAPSIVNPVNPFNGSDDAADISSGSNMTPSFSDIVSVFWPDNE